MGLLSKRRKEQDQRDLKDELFQAALRLELAELGASLAQDSVPPEDRLPPEELFAQLLKTVRQFRGLNQRQLADLSGLRFESISRLERAVHSPQPRTVQDLARTLGVEPELLDPDRIFVRGEWRTFPGAVRERLVAVLGRELARFKADTVAVEQETAAGA